MKFAVKRSIVATEETVMSAMFPLVRNVVKSAVRPPIMSTRPSGVATASWPARAVPMKAGKNGNALVFGL